jgi:hypothetical protein
MVGWGVLRRRSRRKTPPNPIFETASNQIIGYIAADHSCKIWLADELAKV